MEGSCVIGGVIFDDSVILYEDDDHDYRDHSDNHDLDARSLVRRLHHSGLPTAFSYGPGLSAPKIGSLYTMNCFSLEYATCWEEIVNSLWHESVKGGVVLYVISRTRYEKQPFLQLLPRNFRIVILDIEGAGVCQDPTIVSITKLDELPLCICRLNQEAIGNDVITVGYTMKPSREEDFAKRGAFPFQPTCNGLMFLPLTFELPLPLQLQHIDVLLHKATDEIVSVDMDEASNVAERITFTTGMQELKRYMDHHSDICVIDPLNNIYPVLDRLEIQKILLGLEELNHANNHKIRGPHFLKVNDFNGHDFVQNLLEAKLSLPSIVKPQVSCGVAESHTMAICFKVEDFENLKVPLPAIIQEYVDHSSTLYKYYVLGDKVFYAIKKSTPNADSLKTFAGRSELKPLLFDSLKSLPIDNDGSKNNNESIDHSLVTEAAKWLSSKLGLTIFGFDVVVQDGSGDHVIVDLNFLPSFKEVPKDIAVPAFWDAIKNKYNSIPRERRPAKQFIQAQPKKIIIDTDPGIDDAMAIFLALKSPEVQVIGLTTIFGNVYTKLATRNALHLLEIAGRTDIPVAEGSHVTFTNGVKLRIADFVHGTDGLGNQNFPPPNGKPIEQSAPAFLVDQVNRYPGEITVVALGPVTNIALAIQLDPAFAKNVGQIVVLGGSFLVNGNVNPAAEANIFGDPEAADIVFTSGADVLAVGINVTHQVILSDADRDVLASSNGKFGQYLTKILDVYFSYHQDAYATRGVYLHDPTALLAAVDPTLMTYTEGVVRVQTSGITKGLTVLYNKQKRFGEVTEWSDKPAVKVAVTVDAPRVLKMVMDRLMEP